MERLYKLVNAASEADEKVLEAARQELVKLQGGDAENLRIWREMIALSQKQFDTIYAPARREVRPHARRKLLQSAAQTAGGRTRRQGHRARKRRRDCHFLRRSRPQTQGTARAHPQKRRRVQLHDHGPGHAGLPAGDLAAGRNHLCHRRPAAVAFPAGFHRVSQMAVRPERRAHELQFFRRKKSGSELGPPKD